MKPTIGRIVLYTTTAQDQRMINEHPHNTPREQSAAIIVFVNDDESVNLKLFIDGCGDLYKKEVTQGDEPGQWDWPVIANRPNMIIVDDVDEIVTETQLSALPSWDHPFLSNPNLSVSSTQEVAPYQEIVAPNADFQNPLPPTVTPPIEPESTHPLVVLDEATGKHKAVAKKKVTEKDGVVDLAPESK